MCTVNFSKFNCRLNLETWFEHRNHSFAHTWLYYAIQLHTAFGNIFNRKTSYAISYTSSRRPFIIVINIIEYFSL